MGGYSLKQLVVGLVIGMVAGAILYLVAGSLGIAIPSVFINIIWALVIGFFAIAAILFLFSLNKS